VLPVNLVCFLPDQEFIDRCGKKWSVRVFQDRQERLPGVLEFPGKELKNI
jgi:hypothetical protein